MGTSNYDKELFRPNKLFQDARTQKEDRLETLSQNLGLDTCSQPRSLEIPAGPPTLEEEWLAYQQHTGLSFLKACYPLDLRIPESKWKFLAYGITPLLISAIPEDLKMLDDDDDDDFDDDGIKDDDYVPKPRKDPCKSIDVFSLLSSCHGNHLVKNDGQLVVLNEDTFKGKYVLVCCFNVPVPWGRLEDYPQCLLNLCHELHSIRDDFEVVMVARMNSLADSQLVFNHFFPAFPSSCLAVPYEDFHRRDHICKQLKLGVDLTFRLFNADGTILPPFGVSFISDPYGAEAFPFTEEMVDKIDAQRRELRKDSLEQLLRPYEFSPIGVTVYKFGFREEVCISKVIKNKHVGLYMCSEGSLIPFLHKLYERCRVKQQKFEIVVLYCPFLVKLDPKQFRDEMDSLLQKQNVRGWWCLPFNNSVSLRFLGLTSHYDNGYIGPREDYHDKFIIAGPDGKILDMYGAEVIKYGGLDAYPFTREARVRLEMEKLRGKNVTLESLLAARVFRGTNRSDSVSAGELISSKKKIILYMDLVCDKCHGFEGLVSKYNEMSTEVELVFIGGRGVADSKICKMPWYVYPLDGERTSALMYLRKFATSQAVAGFGEDGHLCSFQKLPTLSLSYCLDDTLYQDFYRLFYNEYTEI